MIQGSRSRRRTTRLLLLAAAAAVLAVAATAFADARTDYLVRALRTSPMFRVRTQAAISLGGVQTEPQVTRALSDALSDDHPAVRAAACAALQRQGDPSALPALRRVTGDREAAVRTACTSAVAGLERLARTQPQSTRLPETNGGSSTPSGSARYYVAVGPVATKARGIDRGTLDAARQTVRSTAQSISGVRMAPESESPRAATSVLESDSLSGYYLDVSITSVEQTGQGLRAAVSVVVQSYPDRNIRSMLSGAATVPGGSGPTAQRQAIEGALRGALRNLPQAMAASATASAPSRGGRRRR